MGHKPINYAHTFQFMADRTCETADFFPRYACLFQRFRHFELGYELRGAVRARERRCFRICRIEGNPEAFRDWPKTVRSNICHEAHRMWECDARGYAVGHIPFRSYLMAKYMRKPKARVHSTKDRKPRRHLAVPAVG